MKTARVVLGVVLLAVLGRAQSPAEEPKENARPVAPWFGIKTRCPTTEEARTLALPKGVRIRGQIITHVAKASPAARAGLEIGDVVLKLDHNELYSFDDIRDFTATSRPGRHVKVRVLRGKPLKEEDVALTIGERILSDEEAKTPSFTWDYASLAQLETALERAKKEGKLVLVGTSGAET